MQIVGRTREGVTRSVEIMISICRPDKSAASVSKIWTMRMIAHSLRAAGQPCGEIFQVPRGPMSWLNARTKVHLRIRNDLPCPPGFRCRSRATGEKQLEGRDRRPDSEPR